MRMCDLKGVARPPQFSGKKADWGEFRFKMESLAALMQLQVGMKIAVGAAEAELEALPSDWQAGTALLCNLLVQ